MSLKLYHAPMTRSARIIWLMEEMGLSYDLEIFPQSEFRKYSQTEDYLEISPLGKWPVLLDDGKPILESIAIMEYLMARYGDGETVGGLTPKHDSYEFGLYQQWLHFGEAGMTTGFSMLLGHTMLLPEKLRNEGMAKWAKNEVDKAFSFIANGLGDKDYICGNFTAADISIGYMLFVLKLIRQFDSAPDNLKAYWERLKMRPAWQTVAAIR